MFDTLSERLRKTLGNLTGRGRISEADLDTAMREIRLALLEADVNFKVVKQFTSQVRERCIGEGVLESLNPGQQVVKIVNEELASLMGGASRDIAFAGSATTVILVAGLQGSGKTTACAKLANTGTMRTSRRPTASVRRLRSRCSRASGSNGGSCRWGSLRGWCCGSATSPSSKTAWVCSAS